MSLTVNAKMVAEASIQGVTLRPVVGAYELLFGLDITVNPQHDFARSISIVGARVNLRTDGGGLQQLGFTRPELPIDIKQYPHPNRLTPMLIMTLQPGQVAAIERSRGAGDVVLELVVSGVGSDQNGNHPVQEEWRVQIARSDWLEKLRSAGARNVLLLEVPLPFVDLPKTWEPIIKEIQRAEKHFREGDYHACVSSCRLALDELGHLSLGPETGPDRSLTGSARIEAA